jgi:hypothetical protein
LEVAKVGQVHQVVGRQRAAAQVACEEKIERCKLKPAENWRRTFGSGWYIPDTLRIPTGMVVDSANGPEAAEGCTPVGSKWSESTRR